MSDTKQKDHAKLSASGSAKWLNCAGSIEAEAALPKSSNEFAELGTLAHELADICLKNNQDTIEWVDREISCESDGKLLKIVVDKEMAKFVQEYLDYVRAHETNDSQLYTEDKVDFSHIVPDGFGTLDSAVLDYTTGILHIFDLKYGMTPVLAEGNTQGRLYLSGFYNEIKFLNAVKSFKIHIVQPRKYSITSEEVSLKELKEFEKYAKQKAIEALKPKAKRTPGEKQCEWCAARFDCPALAKFTDELTSDYFEDLGAKNLDKLPEPTKERLYNIPDETVVKLLDNKKLIEKFLKNIEEHSLERLKNGEKIPGYKLVRKKSNRKWTDEAETILSEKLGDDAYTKSLIGITAAEKLLEKEEMNKLTYKPEGGIEMVPESDKREAISSIVDEFEEVEND
jgi:hypothetical protein